MCAQHEIDGGKRETSTGSCRIVGGNQVGFNSSSFHLHFIPFHLARTFVFNDGHSHQ